jgi:hypothetical protein
MERKKIEGKSVGGKGCSWHIVESYSGLVIHMDRVRSARTIEEMEIAQEQSDVSVRYHLSCLLYTHTLIFTTIGGKGGSGMKDVDEWIFCV